MFSAQMFSWTSKYQSISCSNEIVKSTQEPYVTDRALVTHTMAAAYICMVASFFQGWKSHHVMLLLTASMPPDTTTATWEWKMSFTYVQITEITLFKTNGTICLHESLFWILKHYFLLLVLWQRPLETYVTSRKHSHLYDGEGHSQHTRVKRRGWSRHVRCSLLRKQQQMQEHQYSKCDAKDRR